MNTLEALFSRKSIREYTGEPITAQQEEQILKAACAAPVGMARYDSVHLTIIRDKSLLAEIEEACAAFMQKPGMHPLYGAPELILVSVNPSLLGDIVSHANAAMIDHNMALAATELGLGAVCIYGALAALRQTPALLARLNLPEGFLPSAGLALGQTTLAYSEREIPMDRISQNVIG